MTAVGFTLVSLPLLAALLLPVFLLVQYLAGKGVFGIGDSGAAWAQWANNGVWTAILLLAAGAFLTALVNLAAAALTGRGLRQAPSRGGGPTKVPHPDQWAVVAGWNGLGLFLSGIFLTAVLAFPDMFAPVWQRFLADAAVLQWPRVIGYAVLGVCLASLFRSRRARTMAILQRAWPAKVREAVEAAGKHRVHQQHPDVDPDLSGRSSDAETAQVLVAHAKRGTLTIIAFRLQVIGLILLGLAVLAAAILLPIGVALAAGGPAAGYEGLFLSPLVLVVSAGVIIAGGAGVEAVGETLELKYLLAHAGSGRPVELGVLARVGTSTSVPGVNLLGMLGAVGVVLGLPAWIAGGAGVRAGSLGTAATVVGALLMLVAVMIDLVVRLRTRQQRNRIFARWPMPGATVRAQRVPDPIARRLLGRRRN